MKSLRHIIVTHIFFLSFFALVTLAFAQIDDTASTTASSSVATASSTETNSSTTVAAATTTETVITPTWYAQVVLDEMGRDRVTKLAANLSNRHEAAIARLDQIANRLESRLSKIETAGGDTTRARIALADARVALANATAALVSIDRRVHTMVTAENPGLAWPPLALTYSNSATSIRTAQQHLRDSIATTPTN